jgi:hypothetical protein
MPLQRPTTRVCHALLRIPTQSGPACSAKVFSIKWPLLHHVVQAVHKECHKDGSHPHSTEHDTQFIAYLISKQVIPYQTRDGTCCPGGSTPKIRSLADLSMTSHLTWRNPNRLHHSNLAQTTALILTRVNSHLNGWETISHKDTNQTQYHKDGKTCTTLMTAWPNITTQYNPDPKVWGLGIVLKHAGQRVY